MGRFLRRAPLGPAGALPQLRGHRGRVLGAEIADPRGPGCLRLGGERGREEMQMYLAAFPDLRFSIDQLLSSGDYAVTRYTATGTHRGDLMGIAPTNRRAETHGCTIVEIRNGKVARTWVYWDTGHLLRQLGVLPAS